MTDCHLPRWIDPDTGKCEHSSHDAVTRVLVRDVNGNTIGGIDLPGVLTFADVREADSGTLVLTVNVEDEEAL